MEAKLLSAGQGVADDGKLSVITRAWRPSGTIESSSAPERKDKKGSKLIMDVLLFYGLHGLKEISSQSWLDLVQVFVLFIFVISSPS